MASETLGNAPIVIFASGQRCGSTLVQRLLNSHPEVRIWGEHWGLVNGLLELGGKFAFWDERFALASREAFESDGIAGWAPNLLPGDGSAQAAVRAFLSTIFAGPAQADGRDRWGFKEVRYGGLTATRLRALYPELRVIHLTRSPCGVLSSLDWWQSEGFVDRPDIERALGLWRSVNESMVPLREEPWVLSVRYEEVTAEPEAFVADVATLTGLDAADFDLGVFTQRIHGPGERGRMARQTRGFVDLDPAMQRLVGSPDLARVAAQFGYELPDVGPPPWRDVVRQRWRAIRSQPIAAEPVQVA